MTTDTKDVLYIYWDPDENVFVDEDGLWVIPTDLITPNDLYLWRQDHDFNLFPMRGSEDVAVQIEGPDGCYYCDVRTRCDASPYYEGDGDLYLSEEMEVLCPITTTP